MAWVTAIAYLAKAWQSNTINQQTLDFVFSQDITVIKISLHCNKCDLTEGDTSCTRAIHPSSTPLKMIEPLINWNFSLITFCTILRVLLVQFPPMYFITNLHAPDESYSGCRNSPQSVIKSRSFKIDSCNSAVKLLSTFIASSHSVDTTKADSSS